MGRRHSIILAQHNYTWSCSKISLQDAQYCLLCEEKEHNSKELTHTPADSQGLPRCRSTCALPTPLIKILCRSYSQISCIRSESLPGGAERPHVIFLPSSVMEVETALSTKILLPLMWLPKATILIFAILANWNRIKTCQQYVNIWKFTDFNLDSCKVAAYSNSFASDWMCKPCKGKALP